MLGLTALPDPEAIKKQLDALMNAPPVPAPERRQRMTTFQLWIIGIAVTVLFILPAIGIGLMVLGARTESGLQAEVCRGHRLGISAARMSAMTESSTHFLTPSDMEALISNC